MVWPPSRVYEANCEKRLWAGVGSGSEGQFIAFPERYPGWGAFLKTFTWVSTTLLGVLMLSKAVSARGHMGTVAWQPMWHLKRTRKPRESWAGSLVFTANRSSKTPQNKAPLPAQDSIDHLYRLFQAKGKRQDQISVAKLGRWLPWTTLAASG